MPIIYPTVIKPEVQESRCPLDNGRHDFGLLPDSPDLGRLALPLELMEFVLKHLDIPSLTTFRRVSKRAMNMVDSTFEYKEVLSQAPHIIRCALALGVRSYTLHDVYITLRQLKVPKYHSCDYICMATCEPVFCYKRGGTPGRWLTIKRVFDKALASRFFGIWAKRRGVATRIKASTRSNELFVDFSFGWCACFC